MNSKRRFARTLNCPTCHGSTGHDTGACPLADPT